MVGISDLPDDILDIILGHILEKSTSFPSILPCCEPERAEWVQRISTHMRQVAGLSLRLVCRRLSRWLWERHMFQMLVFENSFQVNAFLARLDRARESSLPIPMCRYLKISNLWTWGKFPPSLNQTVFANLDALLERFSESIVTLDIGVVNFFTLPKATIERIGQMRDLRALKLRITGRKGTSSRRMAVKPVPDNLPNDSDCLISVLNGTRGLITSLDFAEFRPVCPPTISTPNLGSAIHQLTEMTTLMLDHKMTGDNLNEIVSLSRNLPNLKTLSIGGVGYEGERVRPLFESLRGQLQEIIVNDARVILPIIDCSFPKLRLFRVHDWDKAACSCLLRGNMFCSAPLQVLALHSFPFHKTRRALLNIPFDRLPHLERIEFHYFSARYFPPNDYEDACRNHGVKWEHIYHDNTKNGLHSFFQIMNTAKF